MFRKILIPLDGSAASNAVLVVAGTLARATSAQMILLTVLPDDSVSGAIDETYLTLERIRREFDGPDSSIRTLVRSGNAAHAIVHAAEGEQADLIAMTTHGVGGLERVLMGSTSEEVLQSSPVPVLVLRAGQHRVRHLRRILVPIDGSPGSAVALSAALPLADAAGSELVLLEVVAPISQREYHVSEAGELGYDLWVGGEFEEAARQRAQDFVQHLADRLCSHGFKARGVATAGAAASCIGDTAAECKSDLIVMSTHALTGPARAILGSVADEVVRTAHQPVLLVRRNKSQLGLR